MLEMKMNRSTTLTLIKSPTPEDIRFGTAIDYADKWFGAEDYPTVPLSTKDFLMDANGGTLPNKLYVVLESGEEVEISRSEILRRAEQFLLMELETIKNMKSHEEE